MSDLPRGYVREVLPSDPPAWRRPVVLLDGVPARLVVVDELLTERTGWAVADSGRTCRYVVPDPSRLSNRKACGRPAVVQLYRGRNRTHPFGYCDDPEHLFLRVWDGERLLTTRLVTEER